LIRRKSTIYFNAPKPPEDLAPSPVSGISPIF